MLEQSACGQTPVVWHQRSFSQILEGRKSTESSVGPKKHLTRIQSLRRVGESAIIRKHLPGGPNGVGLDNTIRTDQQGVAHRGQEQGSPRHELVVRLQLE